MGLNVGIVVAEGGIVLMTVMVRSLSGVVVVVVDVGIVVAIMDGKLELVALVVAFVVGIVSQCVMRACLRNTLWLENPAKHPPLCA